jgi:hypothetical protein
MDAFPPYRDLAGFRLTAMNPFFQPFLRLANFAHRRQTPTC